MLQDGDYIKMVLGNLIGGFIAILVGVTFMPVVADGVVFATDGTNASVGNNLSSTETTLLDLTTLFFALAIMAAAISTGISALRESGLV